MITVTQTVQEINITVTQSGNSIELQPVQTVTGQRSAREVFVSILDQTDFVLSDTPYEVDVFVDRVYQILTVDYTLTGDTVTLANGLQAGSIIEIRKYY